MKRLFIESDVLHKNELNSAKRKVRCILNDANIAFDNPEIFDEVKDFAWHQAEEAWEAVKRTDEIYGNTSLIPLGGYGSYTGAPVVMDVMMQKAIDENITGKSLILLRNFNDIEWGEINYKLLPKAFKHNKLFTTEFDEKECKYNIKEVNISELVKKLK